MNITRPKTAKSRRMRGQVPRGGHRPDGGDIAQRAIRSAHEVRPFVPPVAEELGIEGRGHDRITCRRFLRRGVAQQAGEVLPVLGNG